MAAAFVDLKEQERASKNAREKELENENARLRKIRAINDKNVSKKKLEEFLMSNWSYTYVS